MASVKKALFLAALISSTAIGAQKDHDQTSDSSGLALYESSESSPMPLELSDAEFESAWKHIKNAFKNGPLKPGQGVPPRRSKLDDQEEFMQDQDQSTVSVPEESTNLVFEESSDESTFVSTETEHSQKIQEGSFSFWKALLGCFSSGVALAAITSFFIQKRARKRIDQPAQVGLLSAV